MLTSRVSAALVVLFLSTSCNTAPAYKPTTGERFWTVIALERWLRHDTLAGAAVAEKVTHGPAIVTWRIGRDAALPRAWKSGDCMVTEGTWGDTEFSPPTLGKTTLTVQDGAPISFRANRTDDTLAGTTFEGWSEGDALVAKSEGGDVPAFAFSGVAPAVATLNTYNLQTAESRSIHFTRGDAITLQWIAQSGSVAAYFIQWDRTVERDYFHSAWCTFPGETGTGVVPAEVTQSFAPGAEISSSDFYFGGVEQLQMTNGAFDLEWQNSNLRALNVTWN